MEPSATVLVSLFVLLLVFTELACVYGRVCWQVALFFLKK